MEMVDLACGVPKYATVTHLCSSRGVLLEMVELALGAPTCAIVTHIAFPEGVVGDGWSGFGRSIVCACRTLCFPRGVLLEIVALGVPKCATVKCCLSQRGAVGDG